MCKQPSGNYINVRNKRFRNGNYTLSNRYTVNVHIARVICTYIVFFCTLPVTFLYSAPPPPEYIRHRHSGKTLFQVGTPDSRLFCRHNGSYIYIFFYIIIIIIFFPFFLPTYPIYGRTTRTVYVRTTSVVQLRYLSYFPRAYTNERLFLLLLFS